MALARTARSCSSSCLRGSLFFLLSSSSSRRALCQVPGSALDIARVRKQYVQEVHELRKQYAAEVAEQRRKEAQQEARRRQEIQAAKDERLRLRRDRAAANTAEAMQQMTLMCAELEKERAEKRAHRQIMDSKIEEKRQRERDLIKQDSANWIDEGDLELRIIEAMVNPCQL